MPMESNISCGVLSSRDQVLAEVKKIVAEHSDLAASEIQEGHRFIDDLGCDSLDVVEIAMEVEEEFGIDVPDDLTDNSQTVGDVVEGVMSITASSSEA
jgi:acyl carrier protein